MKNAYDFEYDGITLSSLGYILCDFKGSGSAQTSTLSQITLNTLPMFYGQKVEMTNASYDNCLETTLQICKNTCDYSDITLSDKDIRDLSSWLNRKGFHKFKYVDDDDYFQYYFEATFDSISEVKVYSDVIGLEVHVKTNRPFGLLEPCTYTFENTRQNTTFVINDISDEEGYIYPYMKIRIGQSGDFTMYNELEDRTMLIKNCKAGENIIFDYPMIQTDQGSHAIQNDFNFKFFRIANTFKNKKNVITTNIPCTITLTYSPVVKIGL